MSEPDPNEFTDREKFILSFYRDSNLSSPARIMFYDIIVAIASIVCLIFAAMSEDTALPSVAYALVLGRLVYTVIEGAKWSKDFQSILRKYDLKLKATTEAHATSLELREQ